MTTKHFVRELLQEILEAEGCAVQLAENGNSALEILQTSNFDAIFTDVGMPGMSGWELAQAIRATNQVVPIAVITGWGEAVGSNEQKAAGVDWVVAKPFTADRIVELVNEIKHQARQRTIVIPRCRITATLFSFTPPVFQSRNHLAAHASHSPLPLRVGTVSNRDSNAPSLY